MPRTLLLICMAALGALALATAAAARSPHESTYRPVTDDVRTAKSLVVTLADIPGFADGGAPRNDDDVTCSAYDPDLSVLVTTGEAEGRYLSHTTATGALLVGSEAAVFRTAADANIYWKRGFATKKIAPCVAEAFRRGLPPGATLTHVRTVPVTASTGPLKVMSWNLVGRVHADGRVVPFVLEAVGMQRGRAISFLLAMSMGRPPVEQVRRVGAIASAKLMRASLGPALPAA